MIAGAGCWILDTGYSMLDNAIQILPPFIEYRESNIEYLSAKILVASSQ